ncbi:C39 family peptidase [Patescibacteria group bacterium]|nr:C39 family peptidase [Patescibacteria group bacterium]
MIKKLHLSVVFFLICILFGSVVNTVNAEDCEKDFECNENDEQSVYDNCLQNKIDCIENKLGEISSEKTTLNNTISVFNGNINIQELQIRQQEAEINKLEKEIGALGDRISGLSISLDRLTTLLVDRIRTQYKQRQSNPFELLLTSNSLSKFVSQHRYLSLAGKQTADAMQRAQSQKILYDEQKDLKTIKQDEIETKRYQLQLNQNNLVSQREEKKNLLTVTQNDEQKFQKLLKEAQEQVDAIKRYTANKDISLLSNTTKYDDWGYYYNQRDSAWGNQYLGKSDTTIATAGCLVTSVAMIASHYGKNLTPANIAASYDAFAIYYPDYLNFSFSLNGANISRSRVCYNSSCLDSELSSGKPVIVRINAPSVSGDHFLVITKKENDNYIMKDPYESDGNNISFTDKHSLSNITAVDRVTIN